MAHINPAEFETLWEGVKDRPLVRTAQPAPPQTGVPLAKVLDSYMTMAAGHRDQGKLSAQDYADLNTAVNALKVVLDRINDSALVADAATRNAADIAQKMKAKDRLRNR